MRKILLFVLGVACSLTVANAQFLHVGLRGGLNLSDVAFSGFSLDDATVSKGRTKCGYQAAFMMRANLTRHLNLQAELEYSCAINSYDINRGSYVRSTNIQLRRLMLPVELGLQFGAIRLFGGASFSLGDWTGNSHASVLAVDYDLPDVAIVGGLGVHFRKIFLEARVQSSAKSSQYYLYRIGSTVRSVKIKRNLLWSFSAGFFF
ncbi:MAG: PorT family protein [Alistipes sp.]|nr:PorT family protein [Alistipes sp.]